MRCCWCSVRQVTSEGKTLCAKCREKLGPSFAKTERKSVAAKKSDAHPFKRKVPRGAGSPGWMP